MKNTTTQQIKLLKMVDDCAPNLGIKLSKDDPDWVYLMKWLRSGIIHADCGAGPDGDVFLGPFLTESGRKLLFSLEGQTSVGLIKQNRFRFYALFFTHIALAAAGYLIRMFTE